MEMKQDQTYFNGTYSNLISYRFYQKILRTYFSKSKFLGFMTTVNPNSGNERKSGIFRWDIFKSDVIFYWWQNTKKSQ